MQVGGIETTKTLSFDPAGCTVEQACKEIRKKIPGADKGNSELSFDL